MRTKPTLILSGMIAGDPFQGGAVWAVMQYVLGFEQLGWRVILIEPVSSTKVVQAGAPFETGIHASFFRQMAHYFGIASRSALLMSGSHQTIGLPYPQLCTLARESQLLINISGMLDDPELIGPPPLRIYLDLDPGFVQIWHAQGIDMRFDSHTHFVTVGQSIGRPSCWVPTGGKNWLHTLPPVVLTEWPLCTDAPSLGITTIGHLRAYGSVYHQEHFLGQKVHSLRPLIRLPELIGETVSLAMAIDPAEARDREALDTHGWTVLDPVTSAGSPAAYQDFIRRSSAELGLTKHGYVSAGTGWFSDRSAGYLASGRPVIAQETGWSTVLPAGEGLLSFTTVEQAAAAVQSVKSDPARHRRRARAIAEEYLNSNRVLPRLLDQAGALP